MYDKAPFILFKEEFLCSAPWLLMNGKSKLLYEERSYAEEHPKNKREMQR